MPKNHLIQSQTVEISLRGDTFDARRIQEQVAELCRTEIAGVMEEVFDRMAPGDTLIRIDRLSLNLGQLRLKDDADFQRGFSRRLKEKLTEAILQADMQQKRTAHQPASGREPAPAHPSRSSDIADKSEIMEFYLRNGRLPWFAGAPFAGRALKEWLPELMAGYPAETVEILLRVINEPGPARRFIIQLDERQFDKVVLFILKEQGKDSRKVAAEKLLVFRGLLLNIANENEAGLLKPSRVVAELTALEILKILFFGGAKLNRKKLQISLAECAGMALEKSPGRSTLYEEIVRTELLPHLKSAGDKSSAAFTTLKKIIHEAAGHTWKGTKPESSLQSVKKFAQPNPAENLSVRDKAEREDRENFQQDRLSQARSLPLEPMETTVIQNAGLVLLHPFLGHFFRHVRLTEGRDFVSMAARERAALLLQYLAARQAAAPEQDLLLNKIMCGLSPNHQVPSGIEPTALEKTEASALLDAVIGHWKVLKKTSPETLRRTFIMREGILRPGNNDSSWKVLIERQAADVLLNRLPWGLSVIRLPWTENMIYVQW